MERAIEVGDVPVLLAAADRRRSEALEQVLGRLPAAQAPPRSAIRFMVEGPELPGHAPDVRSAELQLWFEGADVLALEASGLCVGVSAGEVCLGGPSIDLAGGLDRLFQVLLTHALFPHRRYLLHAGAITHRDRAWLLLGGSGMGKSSLALAAIQAGWSVLGDDLVILRRGQDETFEVAGLAARPLVVPRELLSPLTQQGEPLAGDDRGRNVLRELSTRPGWFRLGGCVVAAHGDGTEGSLSRIDSSSTLAALLRSYVGAINPGLLPAFFAAACILARRPGFELLQGRDPGARLQGAQACLAELDRRVKGSERAAKEA